ncbi:ATPase [Pseudomonas sp. dw_358]|uniref:ATPase n=1 Tax=Pseudomonas sp. dw_358 TaxID=2720083 RepID=UPI001BD30DCB|nr:ATPase [Pseudomonas sp. dw_358]
MRLSTLFTLVALLSVAVIGTASATSADSCHLLPVANSNTVLKPSQTVGVLYSENTVNTLAYLQRYHSMALEGAKDSRLDGRIRAAFVTSSDPRLAIDRLLGSLQKNFASVTVYDTLDALVQAHPDVTVMLDTYSQLVTQRNTEVQARYEATFYDANLQYIGHAAGAADQQLSAVWVHDRSAEQIAAQIDQQRQLQLDALKQFDGSLRALIAPGEVASN